MEAAEMDIKRYLNLVYKKRRKFMAAVILIVTAAVMLSYALPKKYEAKCTVFIERNVINNLIKDIAVTPSMEERLRVLSYTMSSRSLLLKVIDDLGVSIDKDNTKELERFINELQRNTDIRMKDMDLFIVSYKNEDPKFASDYINTLVRLYIEENISAKREEAYGANRFLSEQIAFFKQKLDEAEEDVLKIRKDKGIFVAVSEAKVVDEIKEVQDGLDGLKLSRRELEAKNASIKKQLSQEKPYTVAVYGRDSINERMVMLKKRLNELLVHYTDDFPEVVRVQAELDTLKQMLKNRTASEGTTDSSSDSEISTLNPIHQQLKEEASKIELALAAVRAKEEHMNRLLESKKSYLRTIPGEKTHLAEVEMNRNTYRTLYEELVARLGQSEVSKQMEVQDKAATFRIVDPAIISFEPVSPNRILILFIGLVAGLAGGFAFVVVLDRLDSSVKDLDHAKTFGYPLMAVVPLIQKNEELVRIKKKDIISYVFAGAYMLVIIGVLLREIIKRYI